MVTTVTHNIEHDRHSKAREKVATWSAFYFADMGGTSAAFVAVPRLPPRNIYLVHEREAGPLIQGAVREDLDKEYEERGHRNRLPAGGFRGDGPQPS